MEIEFKIKLTKKEAEDVLERIFVTEKPYSIHTKVDRYWKRPGASVTNTNVIRLRSVHNVKDQELPDTDNPVKDWFISPEYDVDHISIKYTLDDERFLTYKNKIIKDGNERNKEYEQHVSNAIWEVLEKCFNDIGEVYFNKVKRCLTLHKETEDHLAGICVDICNVNNGYFYFEVETVTYKNDISDEEYNRRLKEMTEYIKNEFGVNPDNKDGRSWMQIMMEDTNEI